MSITSMAFQKNPDPILWCTRDDGMLLSMTYEREQDVVAWARHPFGIGPGVIGAIEEPEGGVWPTESSIPDAYSAATLVTQYVDPDASGANDGTSWTNAFKSLKKAGEQCLNLIALNQRIIIYCRSSKGTPDRYSARFDYIGSTKWKLDQNHMVTITVADSDKHNGKWNDSIYRLVPTDPGGGQAALLLGISNLIVDGLQVDSGSITGGGVAHGITLNNTVNTDGSFGVAGDCTCRNCLVRNAPSADGGIHSHIYFGRNNYIYNNIVWDNYYGIVVDYIDETYATGTAYVYNNTIIDGQYGFRQNNSGTPAVVKNNLISGASSKCWYIVGGDPVTTGYNYTSDDTSPDTGCSSKTITFLDSASNDYHLDPTMDGQIEGADLSTLFDTDIDAEVRSHWDAGADELAPAAGSWAYLYSSYSTTGLGVNSVAIIPSTDEDEVWVVIARYIDGSIVHYLEQMQHRLDMVDDQDDMWFVDSGLSLEATDDGIVHGLDHLEGEEVKILVDGGVCPRQTVVDGTVNVGQPILRKAIVGLPFRYTLKPMRFDLDIQGTTKGSLKTFKELVISFYRSLNVEYGVDTDHLFNIDWRTEEPYGTPPALFTGDKVVVHEGGFDVEDSILITGDDPLPCVIRVMIPRIEITGR